MKWPFSHETPGRPVSPAGIENAVGPSCPAWLKGTIRTEFIPLRFRASSETITTQCCGAPSSLPSTAVQISPRRGVGRTGAPAAMSFVVIYEASGITKGIPKFVFTE